MIMKQLLQNVFRKYCNFFCVHSSTYQTLLSENIQLKKDVNYYRTRTNSLSTALSKAVEIPNIKPFSTERKKVEPTVLVKDFGTFNTIVADSYYYALSEEAWVLILTTIQAQVKKVLVEFKSEIKDCDDWALLMSAFVASAFAKTNLDLQGAFCITWSGSHAYNSFITSEGNWKIYEPQNNIIQGNLGETTGIYNSYYIWFMG